MTATPAPDLNYSIDDVGEQIMKNWRANIARDGLPCAVSLLVITGYQLAGIRQGIEALADAPTDPYEFRGLKELGQDLLNILAVVDQTASALEGIANDPGNGPRND